MSIRSIVLRRFPWENCQVFWTRRKSTSRLECGLRVSQLDECFKLSFGIVFSLCLPACPLISYHALLCVTAGLGVLTYSGLLSLQSQPSLTWRLDFNGYGAKVLGGQGQLWSESPGSAGSFFKPQLVQK